MAQVFIVHAAQDIEIARKVREQLEKAGISTWMSDDLSTGDAWRERIDTELKSAESCLLLLSRSAANSTVVTREYSYFLSQNKLLYIALIDTVSDYEFPDDLKSQSRVDLREHFDETMQTLIESIKSGDLTASASVFQIDPKRNSKVTIKLNREAQSFNEGDLVALITKLVDKGISNIEVVDANNE